MRYLIALCVLLFCYPVQAGLFFGPNIRTTHVYYGAAPTVAVYDAYPMTAVEVSAGTTHHQRHHQKLADKFARKSANHAAKAAQ